MPDWPEAPWTLRGERGFAHVSLLPVARARELVPEELEVVPVLPGHTLQVIAAARYEAGSTLPYSELLVAPSIVRHEGGVGFWPMALYVDSDASRKAGTTLWGLPKTLAEFDWRDRPEPAHGLLGRERASHELSVRQGDTTLLAAWWMPRWPGPRLRMPLSVVSAPGDRWALWRLQAVAVARLASSFLEAQAGSTLKPLLGRPGTTFDLSDYELIVPSPQEG